MARTAISIVNVGNQGAVNGITFDTGDTANNMKFENDGNTVLLIDNGTASTANITVASVADEAGRTGDHSLAVAAGDTTIVGPLKRTWWNQPQSSDVNVDLDQAVDIVALRLTF